MKRLFSVLFLAVFLIVPAVTAQAATWYVDWDAAPSGDGTTWGTAFQTIGEAVAAAASTGDEIWVRAGTYDLSATINVDKAVAIYGGFLGGEISLGERDWASNETIVDGGGLSRCFGVTDDATIDGFSIVNGNANGGAGIYINSTPATITNCILEGNESTGLSNGGGIHCHHNYSTLVYITNCIFVGNSASDASGTGGAIYVGVEGGVVITNCTFSGNTAGNSGGAIRAGGSINSATITNCIFWGNSAPTDNEISGDLGVTVTYCNIDQDGYAGSDGNIRQDPRFKDVTDADPANWDLHLRLASPCIDVGDNSATGIPTTDIDGAARTVAADCDSTPTVDMGADEFNVTCHCVGSAETLGFALTAAESNGEHDVIRAVQGSYYGAFSYNSSEGNALVLRGGYTIGCTDARAIDPIKTVLNALNANQVLDLYDSAGGDITVDGFTIRDGGGVAVPQGAGIHIRSVIEPTGQAGTVTVTNNIITGNSATGEGGGVWASSRTNSGTTGDVILTNNLIYDNEAPLPGTYGGGVYAELYTGDGIRGTITLTNNTIADNTAQNGGGAWLELYEDEGSGGTINCYNNIIWGNTAVASGDDIYLTKGSGTANAYTNHYADMDGDGWDNYGGNSSFDPLFVGGGVYHLQPLSPCIDSGDDSASVPALPTTDFEGDDRIIDGDKDTTATVDRGADEFSGVAPCDYDGDGKTDVGIYRPSNWGWYLRRSFVGFKRAIWGGDPNDVSVPADYNGDGATDVAVFRPTTGWWYIQGVGSYLFGGLSEDIPVPGDYDGDGATDVAVFRPSTTTWYIRGGVSYAFGESGDIPVPGDYDGDGATDAAVFRPSTGWWYVREVNSYLYGEPGDIPVPADYDGDGVTDIAVYRPSTGWWYIRGVANYHYGGAPGDIPVPGDYYGPGTTEEIGVFSNNRWYIKGATFFPLWGQTGDIPLTRNIWVWKETGLIP